MDTKQKLQKVLEFAKDKDLAQYKTILELVDSFSVISKELKDKIDSIKIPEQVDNSDLIKEVLLKLEEMEKEKEEEENEPEEDEEIEVTLNII